MARSSPKDREVDCYYHRGGGEGAKHTKNLVYCRKSYCSETDGRALARNQGSDPFLGRNASGVRSQQKLVSRKRGTK